MAGQVSSTLPNAYELEAIDVSNRDNCYENKASAEPHGIPDPEVVPRSRMRMFAVMAALFLSLFVSALDATIISTTIPTITSQLHSASGYTWIGGAYLLANTAAAPIWAKLSDIWGRKLILLIAVASFFTSSILCALSTSMKMLIVGRTLQGSASDGLIPLVLITVSDIFSMRTRSLYLGLLELMWALAGGAGPILGGVLSELASWRWIFWINLPISGTAFMLLLLFLDVHNPRTQVMEGVKAIDWFGSLSILGFTLMLLLGLDFGGAAFPWNSPTVICLIIFGCVMSVFFVYSEKRLAKHPLIPLSLFHKRHNVASLLVTFLHGFAQIAPEYYLPLYFQSAKEASPVYSGLYLLPITVTQALAGIFAGVMIHRTGRYCELIWGGMILLTIGLGLFIYLDASSSLGEIIAFEIVTGIGAGLLFQPPLTALQALTEQDDIATATATLSFSRSLATSISVVIGGVVFQNGMDLQTPRLRAAGLPRNVTQSLSGGAAAANVMLIDTIMDPIQQMAVKDAFAWSVKNIWIMCTCVSACGVAASSFITRQVLSTEHVETKTGIKKKQPVVMEAQE